MKIRLNGPKLYSLRTARARPLDRHSIAELALLRVVAGLEEEALVDAVPDVGSVVVAGRQVRALVRAGKRVLRWKSFVRLSQI